MNQLGLTHIAFRVDDLEAATKAVAVYGGRVLEETVRRSWIAVSSAGNTSLNAGAVVAVARDRWDEQR
jgi:hypothetical protein